MELTTVSDDTAVVHDGTDVRRYEGLEPDTVYEYDGFVFRTLARPPGELLARFVTVNDVHFGEEECGLVSGMDVGPSFRVPDGAEPYPEMMNRCAIAEIERAEPEIVLVKGDLTATGTPEEYETFLDFYRGAFGEQLFHMRGNHESYYETDIAAFEPFTIELPGITLAVIDTSAPRRPNGHLTPETLVWLRDTAAATDGPILLFGHHHVWSPEANQRPENYFGIVPDDSEKLVEIVAAHTNIRGYFCGHTHRNRARRFLLTHEVPWVEVASVKEFPGMWAEYRVYETAVQQIGWRISDPEAIAWADQTRAMYGGIYFDYSFGELHDRCFTLPTR